jgi:hypothetical protein
MLSAMCQLMLLLLLPIPPGPVAGGVCAEAIVKQSIEGIKRNNIRFICDGFNGRKNKLFLTFNQAFKLLLK